MHRYSRDKVRDKKRSCHCDGYPFGDAPHRSGTEPWCIHSIRQPTEAEQRNRCGG